jgi:peptidoglycan hydrolase-like protein with peptidoglycan-binding domain
MLKDLLKGLDKVSTTLDNAVKVVEYLKQYGYLVDNGSLTVADIVEAVKRFQKFFGLAEDGNLSQQVYKATLLPRCALPDFGEQAREFARWKRTNLTYYVKDYVRGLTKTAVDDIFKTAWSDWMKHAAISVSQVNSSNANIIISVGSSQQDGFDGPGNTLAWAYLPNGNDSQLLCKFDLAETWITNNNQRGILLRNVACHEFGHLLGLSHSNVQSALMAPFYSAGIASPQLKDDITRIQGLYGKATTPTEPKPPTDGATKKLYLEFTGEILKADIDGYRLSKIG